MAAWRPILALFLVLLTAGTALAEKRIPASRGQAELSYAPLVRKAAPAVVNIYTKTVVRTRQVAPLFNDPFFRRFFGEEFGRRMGAPKKRVQKSLGSGVILSPDGVIVTNHHVIEGADEITVVLSDRREFLAEVVGNDERTDLAVLRIDPKGEAMPFLEMRDSDSLEVGDMVLAIGNPFGVGQTVTSGIVSALARGQTGITDLASFIQTDAAINPGNSGGALIGMDARLVGINSAIFSKSGGSMGIGFAIPSNMVRSVVAGLIQTGKVVRPWFGVSGQAVNTDIAASIGLKRPIGVMISAVHPGGTAERAGIQVGDVVLEVNGHAVETPHDLRFRLATLPVGGAADLTVLRMGRTQVLRAPLMAAPELPARDTTELEGTHPLEGAVVANMNPALAEELGLEGFEPGVTILKIRRKSNASSVGFRPGDRVTTINGVEVASVRGLHKILTKPTRSWHVGIDRKGKALELVIKR